MRILWAEDDQRLGNLVRQLLTRQQLQGDWVCTGKEALDLALANFYEVVILDWMMPEKSGIEVCNTSIKEES